jgi:hypothetical protein
MHHSPGHSRETICKLSSTALEYSSSLSLMILDLVFLLILLSISEKGEPQFAENYGFPITKKNFTKKMSVTKKETNFKKEKESASRQIWASSLIWLLFSPLYLDHGGGWRCSWCIETCRQSGFSSLVFFALLVLNLFSCPLIMLFFLIV